jgi:uncharacterized protein involved in exopolysaccharide biosynthesis
LGRGEAHPVQRRGAWSIEAASGSQGAFQRVLRITSILWARRLIIVLTTVAALIGGYTVILISPPRYLATTRVTLNYIKPDPVTGQVVPSKAADAYVSTQIRSIMDYQVAVPAVEALGWLDSPELSDIYASIPGEKPEFPEWVASRILSGVSANMVEDSNIIEIGFRAPSPEVATTVVDAIRDAYVKSSVTSRRQSAEAAANTLAADAARDTEQLAKLEDQKAAYEKATGLTIPEGSKSDVDTMMIRDLGLGLNRAVTPAVAPPTVDMNSVVGTLSKLDTEIGRAAVQLGPTNPEVEKLKQRRVALLEAIGAKKATAAAKIDRYAQAARAEQSMFEAQKAKVLSQREKLLQLRLLQDEIQRRRADLSATTAKIIQFRQMSSINESGLTPIGQAELKPHPIFPIPPLILGGSGVLGLALGLLLALFVELLARRIRGTKDLQLAVGAPVFGAVPRVKVDARPRAGARAAAAGKPRRKLAVA